MVGGGPVVLGYIIAVQLVVGLEIAPGNDAGWTIVDATGLLVGKELQIVRHGAIPDEAIFGALR